MTATADDTPRAANPRTTPAQVAFMGQDWLPSPEPEPVVHPATPLRVERRRRLAEAFPGETLVVPSGGLRTRANDTTFRFRPGTELTWLVGTKALDAVLVVTPEDGPVLYQPAPFTRDDPAWFSDYHGEVMDGPRPSLEHTSVELGLPVRALADLDALKGREARVVTGLDARVDELFVRDTEADAELLVHLSEARLVKDPWEVEQLQDAVDITVRGFEDVVRTLPRAVATSERWAEGVFSLRARLEGNDVGYGSICASGAHACTLHWVDNDGPVRPGDLMLLDMGAENDELYTADITRTLPVSGRFTPRQRQVYDLVHRAQSAAIDTIAPGVHYDDPYEAAMTVLAHGLEELGLLASAVEALRPDDRRYRRWTLHRVSHMLGLDVHDCAKAREVRYTGALLEEGMVLTVEPGLYFRPDDALVPEDLRGLGVRLEDDVLVTADGCRVLSAALPRQADEVEAWMARLQAGQQGDPLA